MKSCIHRIAILLLTTVAWGNCVNAALADAPLFTFEFGPEPQEAPTTDEDSCGDAPPVATAAATSAAVDAERSTAAVDALEKYLAQDVANRPAFDDQLFTTTPLSREDAGRARQLLWQDHAARIRRERAAEMQAGVIRAGDLEMPFVLKKFGEKPAGGWSLYFSLHGGGGTTQETNDRQWENQQQLYQLNEGIYLVPRAPTNTWNLWHQAHIDGMFERLIENLIVLDGVNPNRIYIMGYSAGGDGVFQLAPRMADRLAAAAMMAGHPNETSPLGLRNIGFALYMGGRDAAYNRNKVAADWKQQLAVLAQADPQGYRHVVQIFPDKGHWMDREDAAAIPWMAGITRDPLPHRIVWKQDDVTHSSFYWLAVDPQHLPERSLVVATRQGQQIDIESSDVDRLIIRLNDEMLDLDQPVTISSGQTTRFAGRVPRTIARLAETVGRGDPDLIFCTEIRVDLMSD